MKTIFKIDFFILESVIVSLKIGFILIFFIKNKNINTLGTTEIIPKAYRLSP